MGRRGEGPSCGEERDGRAKKTRVSASSWRAELGLWVTRMRLGIARTSHGDLPESLPEHGNTSVEQDMEVKVSNFCYKQQTQNYYHNYIQ